MGKRIQKVSLNNLESRVLNLGYVGEHEHTRIEIDCTDVLWDYPNAECSMVVQPPTGDMYPLTPVRDENSIIWLVTDSDVVYAGTGRVQITFTNDGEIVKSAIANTRIDQSIMATGPVPTPLENWMEQAEETARQMAQEAADATVEDLAEEKEAAIADIQAQETATETAIAQAAADARASIPSDYTQLSDDVSSLKSALNASSAVVFDRITHLNTDRQDGYYYKNSSGNAQFSSNANYYSVETDASDLVVGSIIKTKASLASGTGIFITDSTKKVLDYINDSNASEKGYEASSIPQIVAMTIPNGAKYVYTSIRTSYYTGIADFDIETEQYIAKAQIEDLDARVDALEDKNIDSIAVRVTALEASAVTKETGKNKFNANASGVVSGYISSYNGYITDSTTYKTTDFIDISEFAHSVCVSPVLRYALQYNENKEYIQSTYISTTTNNAVIPINENAKYIRISYWGTDESTLQVEDNTACSSYEPYDVFVENSVNSLNNKTKSALDNYIGEKARNVLYGKKWIPFGDSFTDYTNKDIDGGQYNGQDATYPRLIAMRNGMTINQNFFASGRTLAYPSDHTFTNSATCPTCPGYYQNIPEDADYITIMLGINDSQHTGSGSTGDGEDATGVITLGTINDETTETYYGAYNVVLGWIRNNRPFAHVGIIVTNGTERQDYTEAQIAIARKWGYSLINLNGDDRTPAMIRCYNTNMSASLKTLLKQKEAVDYDGTETGSVNLHPNWKAHEYESTFIEDWLRTL